MIPIKKIFIFTIITFIVLGIGYYSRGTYFSQHEQPKLIPSFTTNQKPNETKHVVYEKTNQQISRKNIFSIKKTPKPLAILLFGIDQIKEEEYGRSDSILLALVQPKTKQLMLISIPRDTYIEIPNYGHHKLNTAFQLGGPQLTKETISNWLDLKINETASIDYARFEKLIDLIGGIELDVDRRMIHEEFILEKGLQTLTGSEALHFVRFRKSKDGNHDSDYKRTERQRQLLSKLTSELLNSRSIKESFNLLRSLFKTVDTTLSIQQIITYGYHFSGFSAEQITSLTFNGGGDRRGGLWYEIISDNELEAKKDLINEFMNY